MWWVFTWMYWGTHIILYSSVIKNHHHHHCHSHCHCCGRHRRLHNHHHHHSYHYPPPHHHNHHILAPPPPPPPHPPWNENCRTLLKVIKVHSKAEPNFPLCYVFVLDMDQLHFLWVVVLFYMCCCLLHEENSLVRNSIFDMLMDLWVLCEAGIFLISWAVFIFSSRPLPYSVSLFCSAKYVSLLSCVSRLVRCKLGCVEMQMNSWYWHMWWIGFQIWCQC